MQAVQHGGQNRRILRPPRMEVHVRESKIPGKIPDQRGPTDFQNGHHATRLGRIHLPVSARYQEIRHEGYPGNATGCPQEVEQVFFNR